MQGMNDSKEKLGYFLQKEENQSPKSYKFSAVPALLSRLWWLSSSILIITYKQGLKQDVLQRAVGISVCWTQAPGTLWSLGNLGISSEPLANSPLLWWITIFGGLCISALGHTQSFGGYFFICF